MKAGFLEPQRPRRAGRLGVVSATSRQPLCTAQPRNSSWKTGIASPSPAPTLPLGKILSQQRSHPSIPQLQGGSRCRSTPGTLRHYRIYFIYGILQISVQLA